MIDHSYWREKAIRSRLKNEAESRDSMVVMTPLEAIRHRYKVWRDEAFPWCMKCEANSVQIGGECGWCRR